MKKLLTIATVLLTAALVFTGCSNPAASSGDGGGDGGSSLPGTWTSNVEYFEDFSKDGWSRSRNVVKYNCTNPSSLNIVEGKSISQWVPYTGQQIYGFKAKIKQDKFTTGDYGFNFFYDNKGTSNDYTDDSCYELTFWDTSYMLWKKINGEWTCLSVREGTNSSNIFNDAINPEGQENEVLVYSEGSNLVIKVNGTELCTIPRELEKGSFNALLNIPYEVKTNNKTVRPFQNKT